jgi:signal transduction histidine kinase/tetratricopeptide (TPR) repeat protein
MDQATAIEAIPKEIKGKIDELNREAWEIHIMQPDKGLELSSEAKRLSEEYTYEEGLAYATLNMGVSHRYLSNLEKALSLSYHALEMFQKIEDKSGKAQAYVSIGAIYYYMGDYDRSSEFFLKGLRFSDESGNKDALAYAYNGVGYNYGVVFGDYKKGLEFLEKALTLSKDAGAPQDLEPRVLDSMAETYMNSGQMEKAFKASLQCLKIAEETSQKTMKGDALFTIGVQFLLQNKYKESKDYFLQSLKNAREIKFKFGEADCLLHLGKIALLQSDSNQAKGYLSESLTLAEEIKAKGIIYQVHEGLAELYEKEKDIQQFVNHYKLFNQIKSEVIKDEQENKQKYLNIQFEIEKLQGEAEINRLTNVVMKEKNEELEQSYNSISVLSKIGQDITSTLDLDTILNTVYQNVNELMDATVFGIGIYIEEDNTIEYRLSVEEGKRYKPYKREMSDKSQLAVWCIENKKEVFINDIENEYSKYLQNIDYTISSTMLLEDGSIPKNPNSLIYLPLQVKNKIIGLISIQAYDKNAYTNHHLDILKTLASYTSAALYNATSFEDLQHTLNELKLTQEQLVHSEKMASLGELTAGIAHEIQNPLNFVNNFSEVSNELIDEMNEELDKGDIEEARAISVDIKQNLEKINHHGKRADGIVKGMLQHSRSSTGTKEPTDEYLRLAYHGLRAKDKGFNATLETHFDETIGKVNVVSQDIGRVILNLINNAFYVVQEKSSEALAKGDDTYEPTVTVSTKKTKEGIEISVKDNGNGIPDAIKEKIFQPFFTTKPTGQGTGLGLSLSYDIVKAHGGDLKVETRKGEGTEFIISLPA